MNNLLIWLQKINWLKIAIISIIVNFIFLIMLYFLMVQNDNFDTIKKENLMLELNIDNQKAKIKKQDASVANFETTIEKLELQVDSLETQIYLKPIENDFKIIYDEKIKIVNKYTVSAMQSFWNDRYSAKK